jgi:hypothetical protein
MQTEQDIASIHVPFFQQKLYLLVLEDTILVDNNHNNSQNNRHDYQKKISTRQLLWANTRMGASPESFILVFYQLTYYEMKKSFYQARLKI